MNAEIADDRCEHGYHAALVASAPIEAEDSVEIDHVCSRCGAIEYTVSYTKAHWLQELAKRAKAAAR